MSYFKQLTGGFRSLLTGLGITIRQSSKKPVTLLYPHEKPTLSPAYRSAIKLIRFEESNTHDCVACLACENICPSFCIKIEGGKIEGIRKKRATAFTMDFALCSLCGLCIDSCPTDTLEYSKLYDEAGYGRDWNFDLLKEFRDYEATFVEKQRVAEEAEAAEKKAKAEAAAAAKAAKAATAKAEPKAATAKAEPKAAAAKAEPKAAAAKAEPKAAATAEQPESTDKDSGEVDS